ncbi:MAG: hypothetical protein N2Z81_00610 [Hydrogenothermaceae bacterium]|nr:hypothetical protein [Hydrogenothermaceae bacterium]
MNRQVLKIAFIVTSIILYFIFIVEAITGYWIEKPRIIGHVFGNVIDRRDAYLLHGSILPIIFYVLILFHTSLGLRKYFVKKRWFIFLIFNGILILFLMYLHIL